VIFSFFVDRQKTKLGIRNGVLMFFNILPTIIVTVIFISVMLFFLPNEIILRYLGKEAGFISYGIAAIIGSIAIIPGFIAYPLAGMLVKSGVSYSVVAVFITTLMMVGILTLPLEAKYFGLKIAIIRNALFFIAAIIIGLIVGLIM
jgi:uncharacterized membrane protein YraQ (UPF0718 family)